MLIWILGHIAALIRMVDALNPKGVAHHNLVIVTSKAADHHLVVTQKIHQTLPRHTSWAYIQLQHQSEILLPELLLNRWDQSKFALICGKIEHIEDVSGQMMRREDHLC